MADAMDSKSISRKGVGVQVPASAPEPPDALAQLLLPVLLHRLNNVTQVLAGVNSLVRLTGSPAPLVQCAGDVEHAGAALGRLGWLVHALSRGLGAPIGAERREEQGLEWLLDLVVEALRREGRELERPGALPRLPPGCGVSECWEIARELHAAAMGAPPRAALDWSVEVEGARLALRCEVRA